MKHAPACVWGSLSRGIDHEGDPWWTQIWVDSNKVLELDFGYQVAQKKDVFRPKGTQTEQVFHLLIEKKTHFYMGYKDTMIYKYNTKPVAHPSPHMLFRNANV